MPPLPRRERGLVLLLLATLTTVVLTPSTSYAARDPHHLKKHAVITFNKNPKHQFRSTLTIRVYRHDRDKRSHWRLIEKRTWRAGSGLPRAGGQDGCRRDVGWLPNGRYRLMQKDNHGGTYIRGQVFYLGNHGCRNGTVRQNLFIHTEQDYGSRQCRNVPGDQTCRWEYPRINDYKSNGCIKVAPRSLRQLTRIYKRHFRGGVMHSPNLVRLRVVS